MKLLKLFKNFFETFLELFENLFKNFFETFLKLFQNFFLEILKPSLYYTDNRLLENDTGSFRSRAQRRLSCMNSFTIETIETTPTSPIYIAFNLQPKTMNLEYEGHTSSKSRCSRSSKCIYYIIHSF